jgi:cellulose synthase/poly-beta-1,6-N-acetylglucosamine synthase-like glycosyltransferase
MAVEPFVDAAYLMFAFASLYFVILFFMLFARNRQSLKALPPLSALPSITLIVPAYNEERTISRTLRHLQGFDYPKEGVEILVVDDGSADRTFEVASRFKGVAVLKKKNGGKASALNYGLKFAKGELVGCVDSDSCPRSDALLKMVPFFSQENVGAVTSSIFVSGAKNTIERLQRIEYIMIVWARKLLEYLDSVYCTPGPLSLYRTDVLRKVGGFDEKNLTEDIEVAWKLIHNGYKIRMAPAAEVYTAPQETFGKWWKQRLRWNIGGMQTTLKYRHDLFRRGFGSLGMFVIPFFSLSYVLSMFGLFLFGYIIMKWVSNAVLFSTGAVALGLNPLEHLGMLMLPDVFTVFGLLILVLSLVWVRISLKTVGKPLGGWRGLVDLALYLTVYITIFPFNLLQSSWRFVTGNYSGWQGFTTSRS